MSFFGQLMKTLTKRDGASVTVNVLAVYALYVLGKKLAKKFTLKNLLAAIPGAQAAMKAELEKEVSKSVADMFPPMVPRSEVCHAMPEEAGDLGAILAQMKGFAAKNAQPDGSYFAYMYSTTREDFGKYMSEVFALFSNHNALNPVAFPALRKFEVDVCKMTASLFHGPTALGTMTSGGTESIICAIKTYRDYARDKWPHITRPEVVIPVTGHVAFPKAGAILDVTMVFIPQKADMSVDMAAYAHAINSNTILLVGSAPQYPHGIVDPIEEICALAKQGGRKLPVHVDACIGGFVLPFVERLGYPVPRWDFRVPGVTSISADVHKYGFSAKGASTLLYRDAALRKYQFWAFTRWPGGLFVSPSLLGTRGGGAIASAWAALVGLGIQGFTELTKVTMDTRDSIVAALADCPALAVVGAPHCTILALRSADAGVNVLCVADDMEKKGWGIERQMNPDCIHMTLMPAHKSKWQKLVADLKASVAHVKAHPELAHSGSAAMYGMVAKIPSDAIVEDFLLEFESQVFDADKYADDASPPKPAA
jgi:sphinganine-1-phosphate aldolase